MHVLQEQLARERAREAQSSAAAYRLAHRAQSAQRWQRVAAWAAHRSARAQRAYRDAHHAED